LHMAQLMPLPLTIPCFSKSTLALPFRYWLTRVVRYKGPLNGCNNSSECCWLSVSGTTIGLAVGVPIMIIVILAVIGVIFFFYFYSQYSPPFHLAEQNIVLSISVFVCWLVCPCICKCISGITRPSSNEFPEHVACGRGSVVFWRHYNTLLTEHDFVYDIVCLC